MKKSLNEVVSAKAVENLAERNEIVNDDYDDFDEDIYPDGSLSYQIVGDWIAEGARTIITADESDFEYASGFKIVKGDDNRFYYQRDTFSGFGGHSFYSTIEFPQILIPTIIEMCEASNACSSDIEDYLLANGGVQVEYVRTYNGQIEHEEHMVNTDETENSGRDIVNETQNINNSARIEYEGRRVLGFYRFDDPDYGNRQYWALYHDGSNYYYDYAYEEWLHREDGTIKFDGSLLPSVNCIIKCSSSPLQVAHYLRDNGGICIEGYDEELQENIYAGAREFLSHYLTA